MSETSPPSALIASVPAPAGVGATLLCEHCNCMTQFLGTSRAVRRLGVSRSTIYYWMERGWVHWRLLPSGRRVICRASLSKAAPNSSPGPKTAGPEERPPLGR